METYQNGLTNAITQREEQRLAQLTGARRVDDPERSIPANTTVGTPQPTNYTVLPGGHVIPFGTLREHLKEQCFVQRNLPTMTLADFADMEMQKMAQDVTKQKAAEVEHQAEEVRIGPEGVEERERTKQADWDDWRDEHPSHSAISTKGNYS